MPAVIERVQAVLFDVAGTLALPEDRDAWLAAAAFEVGVALDADAAPALAAQLEAAGRPGPWSAATVPAAVADAYAARDLDPDAHRAGFVGVLATIPLPHPRLAEALYERVLVPHGWTAYPDAVPVLRELRARGVRTAAVSNIGFDARPVLAGLGLLEHLDAVVLSYEVGATKPSPEIFRAACAAVRAEPAATLMVGDNAVDDTGGLALGIRTLLLSMSPAGEPHGLDAVLALAGPGRDATS
jgi:HAD superfamily hydrolase (TIGR01509 family)